MKLSRSHHRRAFTLIELLVVIAIVILVAGLVVGLAGVASSSKNTQRAKVERDRLITLIDTYKTKIGFYPPHNAANPDRNSLLYELAGATRTFGPSYSAANPGYVNKFQDVTSNNLFTAFGIGGVINASDDVTEVKHLLKNLKPDQFASLASGTISLVVPVDGPNGKPNPWNYLTGTNAVHNPNSYDLWVDIIAGGKTNRIANWKE